MIVNYVLMYGTPYVKYREFETFEDVSKFLVNKCIVNYCIFKKLEDKEEVEMIYRDSDIHYFKNIIKDAKIKLYELNYKLKEIHNIPFDISEIFEIINILDKESNNEDN